MDYNKTIVYSKDTVSEIAEVMELMIKDAVDVGYAINPIDDSMIAAIGVGGKVLTIPHGDAIVISKINGIWDINKI